MGLSGCVSAVALLAEDKIGGDMVAVDVQVLHEDLGLDVDWTWVELGDIPGSFK